MKALVNFCVFGPDPADIYYGGALQNAQMYLEWQPEWTLRFYLGDTPMGYGLGEELLKFPNTEVIHAAGEPEDQTSTFWRFRALDSVARRRRVGPIGPGDNFDVYFFRDVDSRPILRERTAVTEFLESPAGFHVMRDHLRHGAPILAGLWGVRSEFARKVGGHLPIRHGRTFYMMEQAWLARRVWPVARHSVLAHVECNWTFGLPTQPFTEPRDWNEGFVGEGFFSNGSPRYPLHRFEIPWDKNGWTKRGTRVYPSNQSAVRGRRA